jgi:hypothetical protein
MRPAGIEPASQRKAPAGKAAGRTDTEEEPSNVSCEAYDNVVVREYGGRPCYEAKFRHHGRQIKRRIGPAWRERDPHTNGVYV